MIVKRQMRMDVGRPQLGDKLEIPLEEKTITATCQKVLDDGTLVFLVDEILMLGDHEEARTFAEDFAFLVTDEEIKKRIVKCGLPTYGMIFGHDDFYEEYLEPDDDEQFELTRTEADRVANYKGETWWLWLENKYKRDDVSASRFASVRADGRASCYYASRSNGARPFFLLN